MIVVSLSRVCNHGGSVPRRSVGINAYLPNNKRVPQFDLGTYLHLGQYSATITAWHVSPVSRRIIPVSLRGLSRYEFGLDSTPSLAKFPFQPMMTRAVNTRGSCEDSKRRRIKSNQPGRVRKPVLGCGGIIMSCWTHLVTGSLRPSHCFPRSQCG